MTVALALLAAVATGLAGVRWLRVAQREHYLGGSVVRFAWRWWTTGPNAALAAVAVAALAASVIPGTGWLSAVAVGVVAVGPIGLGLRGRTGSVAWTRRLRRVAVAAGALAAAGLVAAALTGSLTLVALPAVLAPLWLEVSLAVLGPFERRSGDRWVARASAALHASGAQVIAVTGSYGKTTTKLMIAHLVGTALPTVASPASFNNRMGLARAINEGLAPGTRIFVAEMGTYGPGEIADLCTWVRPVVGVITAVGPVHLERMGTEEAIAGAKREILQNASVGVVNIDHPLLARIADEEALRIDVIRCSTLDRAARVFADPVSGEVAVDGAAVGVFDPATAHPGNVACAVGAALAVGLEPAAMGAALGTLPVAPHRQTVATGAGGFTIIDDTFNANPAGAAAALDKLAALPAGRRVVVTPGMVELGPVQAKENMALGAASARVADPVLVVGATNRRALVEGASSVPGSSVMVMATREDAVAWVREHLRPGDAVLYENDLPDHYP
jgi:UDP-N-acetylmuramoyl-tripeptide--D-alanyl-D-alanine ligase